MPLPENLQAERLILGTCIYGDKESLHEVLRSLGPADFNFEAHRLIRLRIGELSELGHAIDQVTLIDCLQAYGELGLEELGLVSVGYIADLHVSSVLNLKDYIRIVKEKSLLRQLIYVSQSTIEAAQSGTEKPEALLNQLENSLYGQFSEQRTYRVETLEKYIASEDPNDLLHPALKRGNALQTGFIQFDGVTGGIFPNQIITFASLSGVGKSSIVLQILKNVATAGNPVLLFTLEMTKRDIFNRLIAQHAGITLKRFLVGDLNSTEWERIYDAQYVISQLPILIDDSPVISASQMGQKAKRAIETHGIVLAGIDYLQIVGPEDSRSPRLQQLERSCGTIMEACKSTVPMVVVSQFNRASPREKREPRMDDMFGASAIENMSHVITLVHSLEKAHPTDPFMRGKSLWIMPKNRNGPTHRMPMEFKGWKFQYEDPHEYPPIPDS